MPPKLVRNTPDTNALNAKVSNVSFYFDELINDRGTGAQEVDQYFLLSPSDGAAKVSWHRSRIDVRPRNGFRENTAYVVTLLPGLTDLRGNKMKSGATIVFSTGPTIPTERIRGVAFDWVAERPAAQAFVEAITPDSIRYLAQTDSLGAFTVGPLPPGTYVVRAIIDANNNRALDRLELFDSVRVTVPTTGPVELLAAARDTLPAKLLSVSLTDSITLSATFDRPLDPTQPIEPMQFRLVGADSAQVSIIRALSPRAERTADSLVSIVKRDSTRRVDSLAGKTLEPIPVPAAPARGPGGRAIVPLPRPSQPPPFSTIALKIAAPLAPNASYRLTATGIRGLSGRSEPLTRVFTTPRPPARDTTTRTVPDSVRTAPPPGRAPAAPARRR